ncbi:hypothetical protein Cs7R123_08020 [Catellatospora sp. TT07R-123]|uniref:hypothetical protein n=1 Tax=Catellatospora sp. TT07R-123 TaxID=2733863 RepID=UPI001B093188|nr:hypothetical protein [Catellatospora sp. TT07R-123]GHJ43460.1 hypothetical protein Cs7R123_08020 [Catellatospora sp. TT07R-123]
MAAAAVLVVPLAGGVSLGAPVDPRPAVSVTFNGAVHTAVYWGDTIYVGGDFTTATWDGHYVARPHAAAVDARTGALLPWSPQVDNTVRAVDVDDSGVYLAGDFHLVDGASRDNLAKVDHAGVLQPTFKHRIDGHPYSVSAGGGRLYVGGTITGVDGQVRTGVAAFDLATGELDPAWHPYLNDRAHVVRYTPGRVYIGGKFDAVDGLRGTMKIAAVDPVTGAVDLGFWSHIAAMVNDIAVVDGTVYVGVDGGGGRASAMDPTGLIRWTAATDGAVQAIAVLDGVVYLGGHFDNVCSTAHTGLMGVCLDGAVPRVKLAAFDVASGALLDWTADGNGSVGVRALRANTELGQVVAAGAYTAVNGVPQRRFALFNPVSPTAADLTRQAGPPKR